MPRRPVLRRTTGVLAAAALIATVATATSARGLPGVLLSGQAQAASPASSGSLLAQAVVARQLDAKASALR